MFRRDKKGCKGGCAQTKKEEQRHKPSQPEEKEKGKGKTNANESFVLFGLAFSLACVLVRFLFLCSVNYSVSEGRSRSRFVSFHSLERKMLGRRGFCGFLVIIVALFSAVLLVQVPLASANAPKSVDPSDPSVVSVKEWFEKELDRKYANTSNEVVHIEEAQKQVVNGYNYILTSLVKTTYDNETVEWLLHTSRIYEHPPWDTEAEWKYELSKDEVPVFEEADLELPTEVTKYVEERLGTKTSGSENESEEGLGVSVSDVLEHFEQKAQIEYISSDLVASVSDIVAHRLTGEFAFDAEDVKKTLDISFLTKIDESGKNQFIFFESVELGIVEDDKSGEGSEGASDVKLLTVKTSMFAIFLVALVTCTILLVQLVRRRQKKSKEDWYIEQLTDIDEL